jgi:hypothetical protein
MPGFCSPQAWRRGRAHPVGCCHAVSHVPQVGVADRVQAQSAIVVSAPPRRSTASAPPGRGRSRWGVHAVRHRRDRHTASNPGQALRTCHD